ncbi:uroporphyrinogen-III C-methyltransferase [Thauera sinica]|uniref:Uroporphyrinogen-III C-methyltransferase n=1 Tax=Thauera sinica TaxID=2665146 RepID=A0ABW1ART1_9RHOO|nr:uroporphyrinogen-III C-methyltransferase [Thauera sp. K11]ATE59024.1 hypothetical protein CCZ27_02775 [Thauera sp. K11]
MNEEKPALTAPPPRNDREPADTPSSAAPGSYGTATDGRPAASNAPAGRSALAGWSMLFAVAAVAAAGWAGWQAWETRSQAAGLREELARRLSDGETIAAEARGIARQQQETIAALQGKLGAIEAKVEATEGQAAALEALYQAFSRTREDEVVAEVEQTVVAAAQHLQLAGNVQAALVALQAAEQRLALQDRGQLAPLRRALANDIEALRLQPAIDIPGLGLRLERLLERADAMPLAFEGQLPAGEQPEAEAPAPAGEGDIAARALEFGRALLADIWHEVRGLVRIERLDQPDPVLLSPAQNTFLRENLKIRLLTARLALLARDGRTYVADLAQARLWVERFFDLNDERVQATLAELQELQQVALSTELPALTESFAALRQLQSRGRELAPATAPAPSPAPAGGAPAPQR